VWKILTSASDSSVIPLFDLMNIQEREEIQVQNYFNREINRFAEHMTNLLMAQEQPQKLIAIIENNIVNLNNKNIDPFRGSPAYSQIAIDILMEKTKFTKLNTKFIEQTNKYAEYDDLLNEAKHHRQESQINA
jgi:hypothetical protein